MHEPVDPSGVPSPSNNIDLLLKSLALIATLATVVAGIVEFGASQRAAQDAAVRESKKPFLEKQLSLYFETSQVVSDISYTDPEKVTKKQLYHFWTLYWGPLSLVESLDVDNAMEDYGFLLGLYVDQRGLKKRCMQQAALQVTHAMARSLEAGWGQKANLTYAVDMSRCPHRAKIMAVTPLERIMQVIEVGGSVARRISLDSVLWTTQVVGMKA